MIKPRRYLVPFKLLLLLVLSSAQYAPRTQNNKHENEAKPPSLAFPHALPTHPTSLPLHTDTNADKQSFLGPDGGWYENGLGSNF
jgi:hypothetical protein